MSGFQVTRGGILSLVQDAGRFGYQHLGITPGGPLDGLAANWANRLLNNSPQQAVLEVTAGGLELQAQTQTMLAVTGGDLELTVNDQPQEPWRSFWVQEGDVLKFGHPRYGFRAYLGVQGGWRTPVVLGSRATVQRDQLGGPSGQGQPLQTGDWLPCGRLAGEQLSRQMPDRYLPDYHSELVLELVPGYQQHEFSREAWQTLWHSTFELSQDSNHIGARLTGPAVSAPTTAALSEAVCFGAVQITGAGQPVIMLTERQTLGGYPKPGAITPLSAFHLAQRQPGTPVRFKPEGLTTAQQQMRRYLRFFGL